MENCRGAPQDKCYLQPARHIRGLARGRLLARGSADQIWLMHVGRPHRTTQPTSLHGHADEPETVGRARKSADVVPWAWDAKFATSRCVRRPAIPPILPRLPKHARTCRLACVSDAQLLRPTRKRNVSRTYLHLTSMAHHAQNHKRGD